MKLCPKCNKFLDEGMFSKCSSNVNGLQTYCKECAKQKFRKYYRENTEKHRKAVKKWTSNNKEKHSKITKAAKEKTLNFIRDLKEATPCSDCGKRHPYYVMQFDHVRGDKVGNINIMSRKTSLDVIKEEIDKCELVCANCHSVRTHQRYLSKK